MSKKKQVIEALTAGRELTSLQLATTFGVRNPSALVSDLRREGYPVYLNTRTRVSGDTYKAYRLGTASRSVIAAGYKALASGWA